MCILKYVLYCQGQSWASWVMQRTALQYWVCTQKKNNKEIWSIIWSQIVSLKWSTLSPSLSISSRMIFCFHCESECNSALCGCCMVYFDICIEGEWKTRGFYTLVGGCDSVAVVYIWNQIIQTDNGKFHVTIYQSNFHCFEWLIQTSSCLTFSWLSFFQLVYVQPLEEQRWQRIVMRCIFYELKL